MQKSKTQTETERITERLLFLGEDAIQKIHVGNEGKRTQFVSIHFKNIEKDFLGVTLETLNELGYKYLGIYIEKGIDNIVGGIAYFSGNMAYSIVERKYVTITVREK